MGGGWGGGGGWGAGSAELLFHSTSSPPPPSDRTADQITLVFCQVLTGWICWGEAASLTNTALAFFGVGISLSCAGIGVLSLKPHTAESAPTAAHADLAAPSAPMDVEALIAPPKTGVGAVDVDGGFAVGLLAAEGAGGRSLNG